MRGKMSAKKNRQFCGKPRALFAIVLVCFIVVSLFGNQIGHFYFRSPDMGVYSLSLQCYLLLFEVLLGAMAIYLAHAYYHRGINWFFLIGLVLLIIGAAIGDFSTGEITSPDLSPFDFDSSERWLSFLSSCSTLFGLYIVFSYGPLLKYGKRSMGFVCYVFIILALVSIGYCLATEWQALYEIIFNGGSSKGYVIQAFYGSKNNLSFVIVGAIMAELTLIHYRHEAWRFIPVILFALFVVLTLCKITMFITPIMIVLFALYEAIINLKRERNFSIVCFLIFGLCVFIALFCLWDPFGIVNVDSIINSYSTLNARSLLWERCLILLGDNPINLVFGFGEVLFNVILGSQAESAFSHNTFLEVLCRGGILRAAAFCLFTFYLLYRLIRRMAKKEGDWFVYLLFYCLLWFRFALEPDSYFDMNMESIIVLCLVIIPLMSDEANVESEGNNEPLVIDFRALLADLPVCVFPMAVALFSFYGQLGASILLLCLHLLVCYLRYGDMRARISLVALMAIGDVTCLLFSYFFADSPANLATSIVGPLMFAFLADGLLKLALGLDGCGIFCLESPLQLRIRR